MKRQAQWITAALLVANTLSLGAADWTFKVEHLRALRNHEGEVTIDEQEIRYATSKEKRSYRWGYPDIQQLKLEPGFLEILTYEDQKWRFGKDRMFRFRIVDGPANALVSRFLREKLDGVFVDAQPIGGLSGPVYRAAVKHRDGLGGTLGVLEVYNDRILYRSDAKGASRTWIYGQIDSFSLPSRREFELITDEKKLGGPTRTFRFQLKETLPESIYDYLWPRIYGPPPGPFRARPESEPAEGRPSIVGD